MPSLTIGNRTARLPIIQGGMAVRISLSPLAGAVAAAGGIGIIAGSGLDDDELRREIRHAASIANGGVIGVNIMVAVRRFKELVHIALEEGIDLVIAGAGFSRDVFTWCRDAGVPMVPIVGSARVAKLAEKFGAAAVVVEGFEAGGHLGTDRLMRDLLPEILEAVNIPVIGAGGVVTGADIKEVLDAGCCRRSDGYPVRRHRRVLGPAGVQADVRRRDPRRRRHRQEPGRPARSRAQEPVLGAHAARGLPEDPEVHRLPQGVPQGVLHHERARDGQEGDVEQGLVFAGSAAARIHDVPTVAELMARLVAEYDEAEGESRMRRVAVTGIGVVTSTGVGCDAMWDSLSNGRSGISPIEHFDVSEYTTRFAGYVKDFDPSARHRQEGSATHVALPAVRDGRGRRGDARRGPDRDRRRARGSRGLHHRFGHRRRRHDGGAVPRCCWSAGRAASARSSCR